MIHLSGIRELGFKITWRLLYLGFNSYKSLGRQFDAHEIVNYAIDQLEFDNDPVVCKLAIADPKDSYEILVLLNHLLSFEDTSEDIESRKIQAVLIHDLLQEKNPNYINGLCDLTSLWIQLDFPENTPHIIQGVSNTIAPEKYYTAENYDSLYSAIKRWLSHEIDTLRNANQ